MDNPELNPPEVIYHYTSQKGLLEIIKNGKLWATNILYLNDSMESQYASTLIEEVMEETLSSLNVCKKGAAIPVLTLSDQAKKEFIESFKGDVLSVISSLPCFVSSFSENDDQLSQWRGYSPDGIGYSIGFKSSYFTQMKSAAHGLVRCNYNRNEQMEMVKNLIDEVSNDMSKFKVNEEFENKKSHTIFKFIFTIYSYMAIMKHHSFHEEREWRFTEVPRIKRKSLLFREGKSMIIPYIEIPLGDPLPIERIVVGPTPHKDLAVKSVEQLKKHYNLKCEIISSTTPYRSW